MQNYKSGTIMPKDCGSDLSDPDIHEVNHAVTIVGYGKSERRDCEDYWLVKNSWGTGWGIDGHFMVCADRNNQMEEAYGPF